MYVYYPLFIIPQQTKFGWGVYWLKRSNMGGGGYNNEFLTNLQHKNIIALLKYVFPRKC